MSLAKKNIFIKQSVVKQLNINTDWLLYLSFFFNTHTIGWSIHFMNNSIYLFCVWGEGVSFGLITLLTYFSFILRPLPRETKPSLLSYIIFPSSFITYCTHGSFCFSLILWIFFCLLIMVPYFQVRAGVWDCLSFLRSTHDAPEWNQHVWKIN